MPHSGFSPGRGTGGGVSRPPGPAPRPRIFAAQSTLEGSSFAGHVMPYGPTKFVNGQNQGAAPVNTQVLNNDIQVIFPASFASAKAVFPMPS